MSRGGRATVVALLALAMGLPSTAIAKARLPAGRVDPSVKERLGRSSEERQAAELARVLAAPGGGPLALAAALQWSRLVASLPPALAVTVTDGALAVPRSGVTGQWTREVLAQVRAGLPGAPQPADHSYVTQWSWLGPIGDEHGTALARSGPVELAAGKSPAALPKTVRGRQGDLHWAEPPAGFVVAGKRAAFEELVDRPDDAEIFVQTCVRPRSGTGTAALLRWGTEGAARIWLGTHELPGIAAKPETAGLGDQPPELPNVDELAVTLTGGWQRILVKLAPAGARLGLSLRVVDLRGVPLAVDSTASCPAVTAQDPVQEPAAASLTDAVAGLWWPEGAPLRPELASALLQMSWHGWPMPKPLEERLLALEPDDLPANVAVALAHASLAGEAGDRLDRLAAWAERLPAEPELMVARAASLEESGRAAEGHRLWVAWSKVHGQQPEQSSTAACRVRARLWRRISADRAATQLLQACAQRWPDVPAVQRDLALRWVAAERWDQAAQIYAKLADQAPDADALAQAVAAWVEAGKPENAAAVATKLFAAFPGRSRALEVLARAWLDEGDLDKAQQWLNKVPVDLRRTQWLELAARLAARQGASDVAATWLRKALTLSPQRTDLRARLKRLRQDSDVLALRRRDLVALAQAERGARRTDAQEIRWRQVVLQALGNGQQARREAELTYFGPGATGTHTVSIDYAPSLSQADVLQALVIRADGQIDRQVAQTVDRFTEDDSGMYFDLERISLTFKNLRPGDAVLVEHEIRDLGPAPFGLVFGDLLPLGESVAVRQSEVAVQLPEHMSLQYALFDPTRPDAVQVQPQVSLVGRADEGGPWRQWLWQLGPMRAVPVEADAPGDTELAPYLHVSTSRSWDEAARWYASVLEEAIPPRGQDSFLRDLAVRLTQGKATPEAKVRAIFDWTRSQVRYVGLEFGIHSLKPHPAREVAQRQFGDCKDKASLIVALLGEVGIDAQVALVRTADNGPLADGVASLGVFNHAIAWVPALGWWLDATANRNSVVEFPSGDAGAMALLIGAQGRAQLQKLPDMPGDRELEHLATTIVLSDDGSAALTWQVKLQGAVAAETRARLAAAASRKERLEQDLAARWPGIALDAVQASGIEPIADSVELSASGHLGGWGQRQDDQWVLTPMRPGHTWSEQLAAAQDRKTDLVLPRPLRIRETMKIQVPAGWRVAHMPSLGMGSSALGKAQMTVEASGQSVTVQLSLEFANRRIKVEQYGQLRSWLAQVDAMLGAPVALERTAEEPAAQGDTRGAP